MERELWNKIKTRELHSTNLNSVNLTKDLHRQEKLGFFPSTFVKKLNEQDQEIIQNKEIFNKPKTKNEEKQVNSAFAFMNKVKDDGEIVIKKKKLIQRK